MCFFLLFDSIPTLITIKIKRLVKRKKEKKKATTNEKRLMNLKNIISRYSIVLNRVSIDILFVLQYKNCIISQYVSIGQKLFMLFNIYYKKMQK